ncbi:hypothetical protein V8F33_004692 [Rhypophila sp. PSN 637]
MTDLGHGHGRDACTQAASARQNDNIPPPAEIPAHSPKLDQTAATTRHQVPLPSAPDSPVFLGAGTSISEYEFELETLTAATQGIGTHSTDRLVPYVYSTTAPLPERQPTERPTTAFDAQITAPRDHSDAIPNYKAIPLRWPFSLFLLAVLAGLFAFLEYEVHDLPPAHYSVLEINDPAPAPAPTQARIAAPDPDPDPDPDARPPEEDFPKPFVPVQTYCGWGAPTWVVKTSYIEIIGPCVDGHEDCWDFQGSLYVQEQIDTFWTNDTSWCPCLIEFDWPYGWGESLGQQHYFESSDEGCRSAMYAIASFNVYKEYFAYTTFTRTTYPTRTTVDRWGTQIVDPVELGLGVYTMTTPPPSDFWVGPYGYRTWQYPITDEKGNILMAFVTRTAGIDMTDGFGNLVQSSDSALFPERWTGSAWPTVDATGSKSYFLNPCFWGSDFDDPGDPTGNGKCFPTSEVTDPAATVWWTFPLARPVRAAPSAVPSAIPPQTTTDSMASSGPSSTSLAPGPSPTLAPHPTPTSTPTPSSHKTDTRTFHESRTAILSSPRPASQAPASTFKIIIENSSLSPSRRQSSARSSETRDTATSTIVMTISSSTAGAIPTTNLIPNPKQPTVIGQPIVAVHDSSRSGDASIAQSRASPHVHSHTMSSHSPAGKLDANGVIISLRTDGSIKKVPLTTEVETSSSTALENPVLTSGFSASDEVTGTAMETEAIGAMIPVQTDSDMSINKVPPSATIKSASARPAPPGFISAIPAFNDTTGTDKATGAATPFQTPSGTRPKPYLPFPPAGPISPDAHSYYYNLRSEGAYLMVSVVPVLLSTLVLVLLQVLTASLNSILPFRALRHGGSQGAKLEDSLDLSRNPNILSAPFIAARFLKRFKDPLPLLATLLTLFATILVTLSSEVIRLEITSECGRNIPWLDPRPLKFCAVGLRKSTAIMRVAEGLIVALGLLIIVITILLARWTSGVVADPWSIASMASLMASNQDGEVQQLLCSVPANEAHPGRKSQNPVMAHIRRTLDGRRFRLGYDTETRYGIQVVSPTSIQPTSRDPPTRKAIPANPGNKASLFSHLSPPTWEFTIRVAALVFTLGLLILILYYEITVGPVNSTFESFMNSQTIGVRILFASFGTTIDAFWNYYFSYTSSSQIHQLLVSKPQLAQDSILLSPPSNIFLGLWRTRPSFNIRGITSPAHIPWLSVEFHICLATSFAKFTPLLLSNIPFSNAVTWKIHEACTWMSVAFLGYMVVVLAVIFVMDFHSRCRATTNAAAYDAKNRKMRLLEVVGTDTILGCMYYLCGARMVADFEGLAAGPLVKSQRERDRLVVGMGRWYELGERKVRDAVGGIGDPRGGVVRVRVDYA